MLVASKGRAVKIQDGHEYEDENGVRGRARCEQDRCLILWAEGTPQERAEIYERDGTPYTRGARPIAREIGPL